MTFEQNAQETENGRRGGGGGDGGLGLLPQSLPPGLTKFFSRAMNPYESIIVDGEKDINEDIMEGEIDEEEEWRPDLQMPDKEEIMREMDEGKSVRQQKRLVILPDIKDSDSDISVDSDDACFDTVPIAEEDIGLKPVN